MSTRTRDTAPPVKEKRGTSPSHIGATTQRRRSPNPSKTNSPVRSPDSNPSEKNIPNYLKPTASSTNDVVSKQQGKKPVSSSTDSAHKPTLARRRSFDKPPSPSRTQKSRVSPNPTLRSSSFSGKTITSSQKGVPERNLRGPKDAGKQHTLYARPVNTVKKSAVFAKKRESGSGSSIKERVANPHGKVDNPNIHDVPEPEPQSEDQESFIAEAEEQTELIGNDDEKEAEDSLLEDQEPKNINEQTESGESDKDAEVVTIESPTILEQNDANVVMVESPTILENQDVKIVADEPSTVLEHKDASLGVNVEEPEDKSSIEEISSQQQEIKEHTTNEMNNTNTDDSVAGNPNEKEEDKEREEEAAALSKKEEVDSGSESHDSKEQEVQEVVAEEKKVAENAASNVQVAHGKKDSPVSNDVIEETANKLREQRKNKVKALAGAFETVISLQEPK